MGLLSTKNTTSQKTGLKCIISYSIGICKTETVKDIRFRKKEKPFVGKAFISISSYPSAVAGVGSRVGASVGFLSRRSRSYSTGTIKTVMIVA